jgi:hypothetical protein
MFRLGLDAAVRKIGGGVQRVALLFELGRGVELAGGDGKLFSIDQGM